MRFIALLLALIPLFAQQPHEAARRWREPRERVIIDEYIALLSIPNVARNLDDMRRNATHIQAMMTKRGISSQLLEVPNAPPVVYGEIPTPGATQTLVIYVHYDGQPVEPSEWKDSGPFLPILRDKPLGAGGKVIPLPTSRFNPESRLYARSTSDDKAPILALLTAVDALKAEHISLRSNIKFFFDGEEEASSSHLGAILDKYKSKLAADAWIFCDGPVHQTRKQQIVFGVRGAMGLNLTVYGPNRELHSGHYGNWAPNPAAMLVRLVASMRDDEGRILIPGFYEDVEPLSEMEKQALAAVPDIDSDLREEFGLGRTEGNGLRLETLITLPALNIRGLSSAGVGPQSRNVIPSSATASIDIRLVKGMDHHRTAAKVVAHIKQQGYYVVDHEPDEAARRMYSKICRVTRPEGYNAIRAPMDSAIAQKLIAAVRRARGDVILLPNMGGSLPIAPIAAVMKAPVIILPIANHDNNQHAHNENIRIQNLWDGIETMAALLTLD